MAYEIIYVCHSINNKNIRRGELKILRKNEEGLYFEFGESESNTKKRIYGDIQTLNSDYEDVLKLKKIEEENEKEEKEEKEEKNIIEIEEKNNQELTENKDELKENKIKKNIKKDIF